MDGGDSEGAGGEEVGQKRCEVGDSAKAQEIKVKKGRSESHWSCLPTKLVLSWLAV